MSDRRLWLEEPCPSCPARPGLRCQTSRYGAKPSRVLHGARGWRHRWCPSCTAQSGELCRTPSGRQAGAPHPARLSYGRGELFADADVWQELERWGATVALVRFSGGGGRPGSITAVTLEDADKRELARWGHGEGELPKTLAAPIWGRYGLFAATPDHRPGDVGRAGAAGRRRWRARRPEVRRTAVRPKTAHPAERRGRGVHHSARHVAGTGRPGGRTVLAARPRRWRALTRVRALRRADP